MRSPIRRRCSGPTTGNRVSPVSAIRYTIMRSDSSGYATMGRVVRIAASGCGRIFGGPASATRLQVATRDHADQLRTSPITGYNRWRPRHESPCRSGAECRTGRQRAARRRLCTSLPGRTESPMGRRRIRAQVISTPGNLLRQDGPPQREHGEPVRDGHRHESGSTMLISCVSSSAKTSRRRPATRPPRLPRQLEPRRDDALERRLPGAPDVSRPTADHQLVLEYATERAGTLVGFEGKELGLGVVNPRTNQVETRSRFVRAVEEASVSLPLNACS